MSRARSAPPRPSGPPLHRRCPSGLPLRPGHPPDTPPREAELGRGGPGEEARARRASPKLQNSPAASPRAPARSPVTPFLPLSPPAPGESPIAPPRLVGVDSGATPGTGEGGDLETPLQGLAQRGSPKINGGQGGTQVPGATGARPRNSNVAGLDCNCARGAQLSRPRQMRPGPRIPPLRARTASCRREKFGEESGRFPWSRQLHSPRVPSSPGPGPAGGSPAPGCTVPKFSPLPSPGWMGQWVLLGAAGRGPSSFGLGEVGTPEKAAWRGGGFGEPEMEE